MTDEDEIFVEMGETQFISARQMVIICLCIEVIIQSLALLIVPNAWWTWQLLGFITATNLGAVCLAILAQRSADKISKVYRAVFTPDFYYTISSLSKFRALVVEEAAKDGKSIEEEMEELAPKFYGLMRKYVDVKAEEMGVTPPQIEVLPVDPHDAKLFIEEEH